MNIQTALILLTAALSGAAVYLHQQNQALGQNLAAKTEQCEQDIAQLERTYRKKIDALKQTLPAQLQTAAVSEPVEPKADLTKLVSYGHRVKAVVHKYEFLLETAQLDTADKKNLRRLLLKREQLANTLDLIDEGHQVSDTDSSTLQKQLAGIEDDIQVILTNSLDYSRYEFLRERSL